MEAEANSGASQVKVGEMPGHDGATVPQTGIGKLRPLRRLLPFLAPYRGRIAAALVALIVAAATTLAVPLAVRRMIDNGFNEESVQFIDQYFGMLILVAFVLAVASSVRFYFVSWIGERTVADLRMAVFEQLTNLSASFYDVTRTGEVLSRLTADTTQIKETFGSTLSIALRNGVLLIGAVAMMIVTNIKLSGLVLLALPLIVLPLVLFGRWVRRLSRLAQDNLADTSAFASERLNAIQTVQAFVRQMSDQLHFDKRAEEAFHAARLRARARAVLSACIIFVVFASVVGVLWYGARDVLEGQISAGELSQFVIYAVLAAAAMGALSEVWGQMQSAAGAAERLSELLAIRPEIEAPENPQALPQPGRGEIRFEDVVFHYPTRPETPVLKGVSFAVKKGETVAIVGSSGAGKSTIFSLLLRFYNLSSGRILLDDVDIAEADPSAVRKGISVVPQESVIFSVSARENIAYGRPGATDEEIVAAAEAALAHGFVVDLPDGYDTPFGERGVTLSGGQRQRISVARALLKDAPVLLLDEATSALDAEAERKVQTALDHLMQGRTSLVVAHRLATVRNADRILVLDNGGIVAQGTHEELLKQGGLYARLAQLQFASEPESGKAAMLSAQSA